MVFHIITIFPESFESYLNSSMLWRAQKEKKVNSNFIIRVIMPKANIARWMAGLMAVERGWACK